MLFNKNLEKDNCGYGLICNRNGTPSRKIVTKSIDALSSMAHRGGVGFDGKTGDGSGLLFDINEDFYRKIIKSELSIALPEEFAIGSFFAKKNLKDKLQGDLKKIFRSENLKIICFRNVPTDSSVLGEEAKDTLPEIFQVFLEQKDNSSDVSLQSSLFQALKTIENKYLTEVEKDKMLSFEENLRTHFKSNYGDVWEEVNKTGDWNDDLDKKFKEIVSSFMKEGSW